MRSFEVLGVLGKRASFAARILCAGAGYARLPRGAGRSSCPLDQARGMARQAARPFSSCHASFPMRGASRRAIAAFSFRRRAALFGAGLVLPPALRRQFGSSPCRASEPRQASTGSAVSQAPGRHPLWCRAEPRRRPSAGLRNLPAGAASPMSGLPDISPVKAVPPSRRLMRAPSSEPDGLEYSPR